MTEQTTNPDLSLFDRDGHLTELSADRFLVGEFDGTPEMAAISAHLETCAECADVVERLRAFDAQFSISPPAPVEGANEVVNLAEARAGKQWSWTPFLALAAAVLLLFNFSLFFGGGGQASMGSGGGGHAGPSAEPGDGIRLKGKGFSLGVYAKGNGEARRLGPGSVVHPGERLGFSITSRRPGYLLIVGVDQSSDPYLCYPQTSEGSATFRNASPHGSDLKAAIVLDELLGTERIVAISCEAPFTLAQIRPALSGPEARVHARVGNFGDCVVDQMELRKVPR